MLSDLGLVRFGLFEEIQRRDGPLVSRYGEGSRLLGTGGDHDKVEIFPKLLHFLAFKGLLKMHMGQNLFNPLQFLGYHFQGESAIGNYPGNFSADIFGHFVNYGLMPLLAKLPGNGNTRWSPPDDGDFFIALRRQFRQFGIDACLAELGHIHRRHGRGLARTGLHAQIGTQISANGGGKRCIGQGQIHRLINAALANQLPPFLHRNTGGAGRLAGGGIFAVFPNRDKPPQIAGGDQRYGTAVEIGEIAN